MLVAIGMTLVIATGGVDLSVGAVIAISAAMGAVLINPALGNQTDHQRYSDQGCDQHPFVADRSGRPGGRHPVRFVEWMAGFKRENPAHGGDPDSDGGRSRNCPADYQRSNYDHLLHALFLVWQWVYSRVARFYLHRGRCVYIRLVAGA